MKSVGLENTDRFAPRRNHGILISATDIYWSFIGCEDFCAGNVINLLDETACLHDDTQSNKTRFMFYSIKHNFHILQYKALFRFCTWGLLTRRAYTGSNTAN